MSNNINDKMKEVAKKSTFNNNQSSTPINATNKKKDTINFNNVIKNLSTSPNTKPWYKKKASIIGMSSTLGVGVLATAIAVPIVLTSQSSSTVVPPPIVLPPAQQDVVDAFNAKPLTEKITIYNSIVTNATNKAMITDYFLGPQIIGIHNFFLSNIDENKGNSIASYNDFKTFLMAASGSSTSNPFLKSFDYNANSNNLILNMIGVGNASIANSNYYFSALFSSATSYLQFSMYSPLVTNIMDLTIQNDFSIKITFNNSATDTTTVSFNIVRLSGNFLQFLYKKDIVLNNFTLFPNMQEYVKTTILNIV